MAHARSNRKRPPSTPTPSGGGATLSGMTSTRNRAAKPADKPTDPEATDPEATEPEATDPEATEPEATEPEATEPEATGGEAPEPEASDPLDLSTRSSDDLRAFRRELLAVVQGVDHELATRPVDPTEVY